MQHRRLTKIAVRATAALAALRWEWPHSTSLSAGERRPNNLDDFSSGPDLSANRQSTLGRFNFGDSAVYQDLANVW